MFSFWAVLLRLIFLPLQLFRWSRAERLRRGGDGPDKIPMVAPSKLIGNCKFEIRFNVNISTTSTSTTSILTTLPTQIPLVRQERTPTLVLAIYRAQEVLLQMYESALSKGFSYFPQNQKMVSV